MIAATIGMKWKHRENYWGLSPYFLPDRPPGPHETAKLHQTYPFIFLSQKYSGNRLMSGYRGFAAQCNPRMQNL